MRVDRVKVKRWARWAATFVGFPLAGVVARLVVGDIDTVGVAAAGGLAGGAVLGAVQAGIGGIDPADRLRWVGATAAGLAVGLAAGAACVGYRTDTASLVVLGAISGAAVGVAQALSIPMRVIDRVLWAVVDSRSLGRRLADHLAGDRRRRPAARCLRCFRSARRQRRRRRRLRGPSALRAAGRRRGLKLDRSGGSVMGRLGRFVVRRRRTVILAWVALLLMTATVGSSAFSVLSTDFGAGTTTESGRVAHQLDELAETGGQIAIVADGIDVDDPEVQQRLTAGVADIAELDGVLDVADPWSTGADALRATDGRAALLVVTLAGDLDEDDELALAQRVEDLAHDLDAPEILVGGNVLVSETFATASENDLLKGEAIALPIAIIAMIVLLGGLVAGGMPLLVAIGGVVTTLAVLVGATALGDVSIFSVNVVNMLGIGLGIDYGLLMVNRFREERGHGLDVHDAVVATVSSAGTTVVFSALTVAVAMSGLFVFGVPLLTSFGIAGLSVVLLSMAAAVTLLPATLAAVGGRIKPLAAAPDTDGRFYRLTRWVQAPPDGGRRRRGPGAHPARRPVPRRPLRERRRPNAAPVLRGPGHRSDARRSVPRTRHRSGHRDRRHRR